MTFPRKPVRLPVEPQSPPTVSDRANAFEKLLEAVRRGEGLPQKPPPKGRKQKEPEATGMLIVEFTYNNTPHRMLNITRQGLEYAEYIFERQELDGLGDPRWVQATRLTNKPDSTTHHAMLLSIVESLVLQADPALAAAHRMGGWQAVGEINVQRKRERAMMGHGGGPADQTSVQEDGDGR